MNTQNNPTKLTSLIVNAVGKNLQVEETFGRLTADPKRIMQIKSELYSMLYETIESNDGERSVVTQQGLCGIISCTIDTLRLLDAFQFIAQVKRA